MAQPTQHSKNSERLWLFLAFSFIFAVGILLGIKLEKELTIQYAEGQPQPIEEVLRYLENHYFEEIDRDELIQKTIDRLKETAPDTAALPTTPLK